MRAREAPIDALPALLEEAMATETAAAITLASISAVLNAVRLTPASLSISLFCAYALTLLKIVFFASPPPPLNARALPLLLYPAATEAATETALMAVELLAEIVNMP